MPTIKQGASRNVMLFMADANNPMLGKTGLSLAVTISKDGGAFGSISPTITERGNGWYNIALTGSHSDTLGDLVVYAVAAGAEDGQRLCEVVANITSDMYSRVGAPVGASVAADVAAVKGDTSGIKSKTDNLPNSPAAVGSAMTLDLTQVIPTSNTGQTLGDALNAARAQGFGKWSLNTGNNTLTLYAADGTTVVRTFTLDSSTAPTSRT